MWCSYSKAKGAVGVEWGVGGGGGDIFRDLTEMGRMGEVSSKSRALTAGKVLRFYIFPFLSFYPKQHALAFPRVSK